MTPAAAPSEKIKRGLTSAERLAEQRLSQVYEATFQIVKEFYAALPGEMTRGPEVIVTVRGQKYEFSPAMIDQYFYVSPLEGEEVKVEATMDEVNSDELADFLTEGTQEMKNLTTSSLSPCKAALLVLAAYNWVPSSNKNVVSIDRAKLVYKMFHGVRVDIGVMVYNQNTSRINRKQEKLQRRLRGRQRRKGILLSISTASPPFGPPPSTPRPKRTDSSGYVPRQSPQSAEKFQIFDLGTIAAPGQPIDADEAKRALDTASAAIQQLATAMQTLMSIVGQIASMLYPGGEKEGDDLQQQDDQEN
ncbi:hypothetical protein F2Q69_00027943 [Brassica cretica]|uniref:Putative plant transposon protein domain-containing protein n=1 Tax=Brassica cretica TaxID=69181 RepID=A0A8S9RSQ8_BRACR|nr:hypothetical protein F2Q69_00027943 [Brassica cretica]